VSQVQLIFFIVHFFVFFPLSLIAWQCNFETGFHRYSQSFLMFLSCQRDARRRCIFCHFELFEHFNCSKNFEVRKSENASVKKLLAEQ